jgi:hypothetical protein
MMSIQSRRELAAAVALRYRSANKSNKGRILNEFIENTGLNRKYAICVLRKACISPPAKPSGAAPRRRRRKYGQDVEQAFLSLWRVSGGLCPKRLVPFLGPFIEALVRFDEFSPCPKVKDKLLAMSVATAERMLTRVRRSHAHGMSTTLPGTLLRQQIPIRTYEDWTEARPGFMEVDLVAHGGGTASGEYLYTLTMTDISTGWTECTALVNRSQVTVQKGVDLVRRRLPFPLLGIDSDNGSEFINHHLKRYCDEHRITFTRCRPYKKNDQCHVEQKNGAVVRPLVGYARYEGQTAADHFNRLYLVHGLFLNYFQPSMKLTGKSRVGARVKKTYDTPQTPWQRLQTAKILAPEAEERLCKQYLTLNPAKLRREIADLEMGLPRLAQDAERRNVTIEGGDSHGPAA